MAGDLRTTNGNSKADSGKLHLLTRGQLDGRTKARRLFDSIADGIAADLGGEDRLSTIEKHLVEAFAGVAVHVNAANARLLLGHPVDLGEIAQACSTLVRIATRLGTKRVAKEVPSLETYLAGKYATRRNNGHSRDDSLRDALDGEAAP